MLPSLQPKSLFSISNYKEKSLDVNFGRSVVGDNRNVALYLALSLYSQAHESIRTRANIIFSKE